MTAVTSFIARFEANVDELWGADVQGVLIVALSGGLDSCALLHLLRFVIHPRPQLVAAHFDHGMRQGSADDAAWIRGMCRVWDVPLALGHADDVLTSEAKARVARYSFLESVREEWGEAARLLTAHHADDQAETVLFRVLRGTGIAGLRGIPATRDPGIVRPLLDVWRDDLVAYARSVSLSWREDESNRSGGYARNVVRSQVLPLAEQKIASRARRALVRLSHIAAENESAWAEVLPDVIVPLNVKCEHTGAGPRVSWDRASFQELPRSLRGRVFRHLVRGQDRVLCETATRLAGDFLTTSRSGSRIDLGGGVELRRELDRFVVGPSALVSTPIDEPCHILDAGSGIGRALVGGRCVRVMWGPNDDEGTEFQEDFSVADLDFPLTVRGRKAGDRIVLPRGTRKVKRLMLEARIALGSRSQIPVLVDRAGRVIWVPGVARTSEVGGRGTGGDQTLTVRFG